MPSAMPGMIAGDLLHARGNVADREADAPVVRWIRRRAVHEAHMVQRDLTRLKIDRDGLRRVDFHSDFLPAREEVVFRERVAMRDLVARVRPGNEFHRAIRLVARRERDPCGDDVGAVEPPVGRVLVP